MSGNDQTVADAATNLGLSIGPGKAQNSDLEGSALQHLDISHLEK